MLNSKNWKKTRFRGNEIYQALQESLRWRSIEKKEAEEEPWPMEAAKEEPWPMEAGEDTAYQRSVAVIWRSQLEELEEHGISKNNGLSLPITSVLNSKNACKDLHALVRHKSTNLAHHTQASVHHPNLPPRFTSLLLACGHFLLRCLPATDRT
ncbi:hypothetical protein SLEP1_g16039 [Rubroshorea leprosula]|uniref:Uncharacterized protein n=1 Tax=Rubroshorea leprosula TaxID=152421 RepID=A0AAV5IZZ5_9ROSI|nr:hypothetical protein SLEP1_g16039 [Rubroshorea leprosula]